MVTPSTCMSLTWGIGKTLSPSQVIKKPKIIKKTIIGLLLRNFIAKVFSSFDTVILRFSNMLQTDIPFSLLTLGMIVCSPYKNDKDIRYLNRVSSN